MGVRSKLTYGSQADLLAILDRNPVRAQEKYGDLQRKLIRYLEWNRVPDPEDLAQEALQRGFLRLQQGQRITTDDPAKYFFGIARNLVRESRIARRPGQLEEQAVVAKKPTFHNLNSAEQGILLRQCLCNLHAGEFEMLLAYVEGNGEAWAQKAGLEPSALRLRIHRLRKRLEKLAGVEKG